MPKIPGKIEELEKKIGDGVKVDLKDYVTKDESRTISSNIVSKAEEMDRNLSSNLQKRIDYVDEKVDSTYKEIVNIQS